MGEITTEIGFVESEREQIASLYWEAFRQKLRPAFKDAETGTAVLSATMHPDRVLVARINGNVVGVCGFYADGKPAADLGFSSLRRLLPLGQAIRAAIVLSFLEQKEQPGKLLLDSICVDAKARGTGIGTTLLDATESYARERGMSSVCLSVIESNPQAEALYRRQGFVPVERGSLGVLKRIYGFDRYTDMEKQVAP